ncbi:MAG: YlxR family protein [Angustibacter sp.]
MAGISLASSDTTLSGRAQLDPQRTCVGCRRKGDRSALLRFVVTGDGAVVLDERRRLPGRGAWLHPDRRCAELAVRRSAFLRALRLRGVGVRVDVTQVLPTVPAPAQGAAREHGKE